VVGDGIVATGGQLLLIMLKGSIDVTGFNKGRSDGQDWISSVAAPDQIKQVIGVVLHVAVYIRQHFLVLEVTQRPPHMVHLDIDEFVEFGRSLQDGHAGDADLG
jgi:hypothetical protein